jgi:hypothetical protein
MRSALEVAKSPQPYQIPLYTPPFPSVMPQQKFADNTKVTNMLRNYIGIQKSELNRLRGDLTAYRQEAQTAFKQNVAYPRQMVELDSISNITDPSYYESPPPSPSSVSSPFTFSLASKEEARPPQEEEITPPQLQKLQPLPVPAKLPIPEKLPAPARLPIPKVPVKHASMEIFFSSGAEKRRTPTKNFASAPELIKRLNASPKIPADLPEFKEAKSMGKGRTKALRALASQYDVDISK